jgi:hypothetical protein
MMRLSRESREDGEMNCQQFQRVLPQIIESGGNPEEEDHLKSCPACSELVRDLKYIAEQAKLLLPLHDPNPRVWNNIQESLSREGLVREGRMSLRGQTPATSPKKKSWTSFRIMFVVLAVLGQQAALLNYRPSNAQPHEKAAPMAAAADKAGSPPLVRPEGPKTRC